MFSLSEHRESKTLNMIKWQNLKLRKRYINPRLLLGPSLGIKFYFDTNDTHKMWLFHIMCLKMMGRLKLNVCTEGMIIKALSDVKDRFFTSLQGVLMVNYLLGYREFVMLGSLQWEEMTTVYFELRMDKTCVDSVYDGVSILSLWSNCSQFVEDAIMNHIERSLETSQDEFGNIMGEYALRLFDSPNRLNEFVIDSGGELVNVVAQVQFDYFGSLNNEKLLYPREGLLFRITEEEEAILDMMKSNLHPDLLILPDENVEPVVKEAIVRAYLAYKSARCMKTKLTASGKEIMRLLHRNLNDIDTCLSHFNLENLDRVYKIRYHNEIDFELAGRVVIPDSGMGKYYFYVKMDGAGDYEFDWDVYTGFIFVESCPKTYSYIFNSVIQGLFDKMQEEGVEEPDKSELSKYTPFANYMMNDIHNNHSSLRCDFLMPGMCPEFDQLAKIVKQLRSLKVQVHVVGKDEEKYWKYPRITIRVEDIDRMFWLQVSDDRYEVIVRMMLPMSNNHIYISMCAGLKNGRVLNGVKVYLSRFAHLFFAIVAHDFDSAFWDAMANRGWICEDVIAKIKESSQYVEAMTAYKSTF